MKVQGLRCYKDMNKYQEALYNIVNTIMDEGADGYWQQKTAGDYCWKSRTILQELVDKADSFEWISVSERMPKEHDSIFAKFYGTDKWNSKLWRTVSDRVLVTVKYDDGTRIVKESHTHDGKWVDEKRNINLKVEAWMPLPKPYRSEENE